MTVVPKTVLIVDDDVDTRALLAELLRTRGYDVIEAWDGLDGLELLQTSRAKIDVVMLDLEMPNIDGSSFRSLQLHFPALRGVPVIVSSGHPQAHAIAGELEALAVVPKPVVTAMLDAALDKAFAQPRL